MTSLRKIHSCISVFPISCRSVQLLCSSELMTASSSRQTIAPFPKHDNTRFDLSQSAVKKNTQVQGVLSPTRPQMTAVKRSRCEAHSPCAVAPQHTSPTRSRELEYAGPISFSRNCAQCIGRRRSSLHQPVCYSLTNF